MNTYFEHEADKLATYRPLGISPGDEVRETTHEQIYYILVGSKEARVERNVVTDTAAPLMTDHYPLVSDFHILFHRKGMLRESKCTKYCKREMYLNKNDMNAFLRPERQKHNFIIIDYGWTHIGNTLNKMPNFPKHRGEITFKRKQKP